MRGLLIALVLNGCQGIGSNSSSLSAEDEILLSTTNGEEETLAERSTLGGMGDEGDPNRPPIGRECGADGTYTGILDSYDADGDGSLSPEECGSVDDAHSDRDRMEQQMAEMRWHLMLLVYDEDLDGSLSDGEKQNLFDDFTTRCETLYSKLLADFDADGDGALSDSELATADEALRAEHDEHQAEMEQRMEDGEEPSFDPSAGPPEIPPGLEDYDTDGDGSFSADELVALRADLRAKIRAGDPVVEPPPPPPPPSE